jgi:hypothetical protein
VSLRATRSSRWRAVPPLRVGRILERHGRSLEGLFEGDDSDDDRFAQQELALASCYGAALRGMSLLTPLRSVDLPGLRPAELDSVHSGSACAPDSPPCASCGRSSDVMPSRSPRCSASTATPHLHPRQIASVIRRLSSARFFGLEDGLGLEEAYHANCRRGASSSDRVSGLAQSPRNGQRPFVGALHLERELGRCPSPRARTWRDAMRARSTPRASRIPAQRASEGRPMHRDRLNRSSLAP